MGKSRLISLLLKISFKKLKVTLLWQSMWLYSYSAWRPHRLERKWRSWRPFWRRMTRMERNLNIMTEGEVGEREEMDKTWSRILVSIFRVRKAYIGQKHHPHSEDHWRAVHPTTGEDLLQFDSSSRTWIGYIIWCWPRSLTILNLRGWTG